MGKLEPTYENAKKLASEAHEQAAKEHLDFENPFPDPEIKEKASNMIQTDYRELARSILIYERSHRQSIPGHRYKNHLRKIACAAPTLLVDEFERKGLEDPKNEYFRILVVAGLLHDIDRHKDAHNVEGMNTASNLLYTFSRKIKARNFQESQEGERINVPAWAIRDLILQHDNAEFDCQYWAEPMAIVYRSLFDADKFLWGRERANTYWDDREHKGVPIEEALSDYQFLEKVLQNPEFFKTEVGKKIGPRFINYGLDIAKTVEEALLN